MSREVQPKGSRQDYSFQAFRPEDITRTYANRATKEILWDSASADFRGYMISYLPNRPTWGKCETRYGIYQELQITAKGDLSYHVPENGPKTPSKVELSLGHNGKPSIIHDQTTYTDRKEGNLLRNFKNTAKSIYQEVEESIQHKPYDGPTFEVAYDGQRISNVEIRWDTANLPDYAQLLELYPDLWAHMNHTSDQAKQYRTNTKSEAEKHAIYTDSGFRVSPSDPDFENSTCSISVTPENVITTYTRKLPKKKGDMLMKTTYTYDQITHAYQFTSGDELTELSIDHEKDLQVGDVTQFVTDVARLIKDTYKRLHEGKEPTA